MAGNVVGIYCVALEVKEQTVHERLFVPIEASIVMARQPQIITHWAFVKTTAIDSELQRRRFGAITKARFAEVILVTA